MKDKFIILGVATVWNERKGLADFIRLAELLDKDEHILLVGLSPKQIKQLPHNITGMQKTENVEELVRLYSNANVYISFSVEETFGLTTAESLACGTPVMVVNSTASPEIITKEVGFVVEPHDVQTAKKNILEIKKKGKNTYRDMCRQYAVQNFNEMKLYQEYIHLYEKLWNHENITDHHYL